MRQPVPGTSSFPPEPESMELKDCFKAGDHSYDKARTPDQTLEWVFERFERFGRPVLKSVERVDKDRLGIPVYVSRYEPQAGLVTGSAKQMGKGVTEAQAKASAVMEIVERFSLFEFLRQGPMWVEAPGRLSEPGFEDSLLLKAIHCHDDSPEALEVLRQFPIQWADGMNALTQQPSAVPFSWMWPINKYNGAAAGNSLEEAAVQAISEVVERHVCSLISYRKLETPTIDLDSIEDPQLRELVQRFVSCGINLILKDFSLGIGIPTIGAIAWDPATFPQRSEIVYTAGTSTSPVRAAVRAVTEIAQLAGDFDTEGRYVESGLPKFASLEEASYVISSPCKVKLHDLPDCSSPNFRQEVVNLASALTKAELTTFLQDITHPELAIPAVYAVIPGNHFRERTRNLSLPFHIARLAATGNYIPTEESSGILMRLEEFFPGRFETAFYLGHNMEKEGRFSEALEYFLKSLERRPDPEELASIYCHIGNCHLQLGELERAISALEKARGLNSELKEIHNLLGVCHYKKGEFIEAIECFENAISIDPSSAIDYANIGSNLRKLGTKEAAVQWYQMALELDPDLDWARRHMEELSRGDSAPGQDAS